MSRSRYSTSDTLTIPLPEHGTSARYQRGCRCELCRCGVAAAQRILRRRKAEAEGRTPPERTLSTLCWCEAKQVRVPEADVRAGLTKCCRRAECRAIRDKANP